MFFNLVAFDNNTIVQFHGFVPQKNESFARWQSGQAPDGYSGATFSSFDHVGAKSLRFAVVSGRMNDAQTRDQLKFESIKAIR